MSLSSDFDKNLNSIKNVLLTMKKAKKFTHKFNVHAAFLQEEVNYLQSQINRLENENTRLKAELEEYMDDKEAERQDLLLLIECLRSRIKSLTTQRNVAH